MADARVRPFSRKARVRAALPILGVVVTVMLGVMLMYDVSFPGRTRRVQGVVVNLHQGRDEFLGFLGRVMELSGGTFRVESREMVATPTGGIFVDRVTAERNGRTLDVRLLLAVRIADGRILEGIDHFHQEHLWDAFWS